MKRFRKADPLVQLFLIVTTLLLATTSILDADGAVPYTFAPGLTISSDQVNANFKALADQITALQAQLTPVSIVGTYDYFSFGIGMSISYPDESHPNYKVTRNSYQGTLVFAANGTVTVNGTGGYSTLNLINEISAGKSLISGTFSTDDPTDNGTENYTVNGSTVTMAGGKVVGTLSADGKILVARVVSNATGIMIAIRRQ
jgi:hypothetical protein